MAGSEEKLWEHQIDSQVVYDAGFLRVFKDRVRTSQGAVTHREYVAHPGASAVLAWNADEELIVVRQFRYAVGRICLEIPAGRIDLGEHHQVAAMRELREETGVIANTWRYLGNIFPCVGYSNEIIHIYEARDLAFTQQDLDEHEAIEWTWMDKKQIQQAILTGALNDAKTLAALRLIDG
jgi:ADP-ribose pyrophosphatase